MSMVFEGMWFLAGIFAGILTGLIPGIHPNTVTVSLLPLYPLLPSQQFLAFIIALAVSNTIFDLIPAIFIGVPEDDTVMALFPTHLLVQQGLGYYALKLTIFGALFGSICAIVLSLITLPYLQSFYTTLTTAMAPLIIAFISFMLFTESQPGRSFLILLLSGILGNIVLNASLINTQYILFPLLSGLFALPPLLAGSSGTAKNYTQQERQTTHTTIAKGSLIGTGASFLVGFIPGIGDAQSALFFNKLSRLNTDEFVVALGGINTAGIILSFISLFAIGRTRSGAAAAISQSLDTITYGTVLRILAFSVIALGFSAILCLLIGKSSTHLFTRLNMTLVNRAVIILLIALILFFTGLFGIFVFITASSIGLFAVSSGVKRSFCMGVLLLPTLTFYLGIGPFII